MTRTGKIILACTIALAVVAGVAAKWIFFPSVKDSYFTLNQQVFRQVPSGMVAVRTTHFPRSVRKGIISDTIEVHGKPVWRMMGRNVTFQQVVAVAYGENAARVVLPPTAPNTNFDFLVTVRGDLRKSLQTAIRKKLGYVAQTEKRDTDVLSLKIRDASLPGLSVSDAGTKQNVNFDKGKIHFSHMRLQAITGGLEQVLKKPIVDKTDLTNFYDFSAVFDYQMQRQLNNENTAPDAVKKLLNGWGLTLEPDTEWVEVLVVKNAG